MGAVDDDHRDWTYKLTNTLKEDHGQPIYSLCFNLYSKANPNVFASCGSNKATIYQCKEEGAVDILQAYIDEDAEEEFYVCKWTVETLTGTPLLLVAGKTGLLKVLDCIKRKLDWCAEGHGSAINDIAVHPTEPSLILTASRDSSLRLWNIQSRVCVLIMTGEECHRNEVLSVDFHPMDGNLFASGGMDNTVKLWNMGAFGDHLEASFDYDVDCGKVYNTKFLPHPNFSSHKVHFNYVDCVKYIGDLILSKSVDNRILLWRPHQKEGEDELDTAGHIHLVQEMEMEDCENLWFLRFAMDRRCRTLACGTRTGQVFLFDPHTPSKRSKARLKRGSGPATNTSTVRQTAVSGDGRIVLGCCDDATIWRWDAQPKG